MRALLAAAAAVILTSSAAIAQAPRVVSGIDVGAPGDEQAGWRRVGRRDVEGRGPSLHLVQDRPPLRGTQRDDQPPPAEAPTGDEGWWVVLAAFPKPLPQPDPVPRVNALAVKCGIRTFSTSSDDFGEFKPGFIVVVSGAYPSRAEAEAIASRARPCIPEASVKYSPHEGG